jgi:hypothetical protein
MNPEAAARAAIDTFVTEVRQDLNRHLESLTADLLGAAAGRHAASRADLERAAVEVARAVGAGRTGDDRVDVLARLLGAIRGLDEAQSLTAILEALGLGASFEATRVAVMLRDGDTLRSWRHFGYVQGQSPVDTPLHSFDALRRAVVDEQRLSVTPSGQGASLDLPAFMRVPPGHSGVVIPLVISRQVAALLYAEGEDRRPGQTPPPIWLEQVEVLTRHAASRLENVTSLRTVEVLTGPG